MGVGRFPGQGTYLVDSRINNRGAVGEHSWKGEDDLVNDDGKIGPGQFDTRTIGHVGFQVIHMEGWLA